MKLNKKWAFEKTIKKLHNKLIFSEVRNDFYAVKKIYKTKQNKRTSFVMVKLMSLFMLYRLSFCSHKTYSCPHGYTNFIFSHILCFVLISELHSVVSIFYFIL